MSVVRSALSPRTVSYTHLAALGQLSAGERLLFYRKYYYLRSTAQIALELGLTERADGYTG